jgi:hypothetical protein
MVFEQLVECFDPLVVVVHGIGAVISLQAKLLVASSYFEACLSIQD